jgi:hypothetical protein
LDFSNASFQPYETDSPLIIDPDTVLTLAVPFERFESVGRRDAQISKTSGAVQHSQLSSCDRLNGDWNAPGQFAPPYAFGLR